MSLLSYHAAPRDTREMNNVKQESAACCPRHVVVCCQFMFHAGWLYWLQQPTKLSSEAHSGYLWEPHNASGRDLLKTQVLSPEASRSSCLGQEQRGSHHQASCRLGERDLKDMALHIHPLLIREGKLTSTRRIFSKDFVTFCLYKQLPGCFIF